MTHFSARDNEWLTTFFNKNTMRQSVVNKQTLFYWEGTVQRIVRFVFYCEGCVVN